MERLRQVESSFVRGQVMDGGPQVEHVALSPAVGVKTLEDVFAEVSREGAL